MTTPGGPRPAERGKGVEQRKGIKGGSNTRKERIVNGNKGLTLWDDAGKEESRDKE